ncbi:Nucleotidylyl transferase [Meredithblackwellia eburnea MCA 4105]
MELETPPIADYTFPTHRLSTIQPESSSAWEPLVLVAAGSFSPITILHLRMFEQARDHAHFQGDFRVVGGYLSPVSSSYAKAGLAPAHHRVNMCQLACDDTSDWLMVDPWEALVKSEYTPTARVLDHFDEEINVVRGGITVEITDEVTGETKIEKRKARIMLLAGSDLIRTFSQPGVWSDQDLHHILLFGLYIIERAESDRESSEKDNFLSETAGTRSPLSLYRSNIRFVEQLVRNDISSTKVRLFLRKGMSVRYLTPEVVLDYIEQHQLFLQPDRKIGTGPPSRRNSPAPEERSSSRSSSPSRKVVGVAPGPSSRK